jgi:hypothetical protein
MAVQGLHFRHSGVNEMLDVAGSEGKEGSDDLVFEDIFVPRFTQVTKLAQVVGELDPTGRSDFTVDFVGRTRHIGQNSRMGRYTAGLARERVEY